MKITNLYVDGFGVWSDLKIEQFSDSLNVLYGPNEAGKTTLLQFIRSMLYGISPQRQRYLPPVHGGRPGGALAVAGPNGRFQIDRYNAAPDGSPGEHLALTAPDGTRQGEHFIKVLLSNVDEAVFNNVFAVGLREIQELATLSDTEAAELLYNLTAGLDRVSLVEVVQELEASRNRALDSVGGPCQIVQLLDEREKLQSEIEELGAVNRRYGHLIAERNQIHGEVTRIEEEATRSEHLTRVMDLALAVRDRWVQRAGLDEQLAAFGPLKTMPEGAIERLDALNARSQKHLERINQLSRLREELRREFAGLSINNALWRQAARIEAFQEQEPWVAQLQGRIGELENEIDVLASELSAESEQLGLGPDPASLPVLSAARISMLRMPAKRVNQSHRRLKDAKQSALAAQQATESLARRIASALATCGQSDLSTAMDRSGGMVSQLRRRVQIDERLDQLARYQVELEEKSRYLVDRQLLPIWVLVGLGAVFVVGVVLVLAGLFMPASITGSIGWALSLLGLAGGGAAVLGKVMLERSNVHQLDACQKQLGVLQLQVQQTKDDREALDDQLPRGGGPLSNRLQEAERELAALEELAPLDAHRAAARQEADAAGRRVAEAEEEYKSARRRWRDALSAIGLPQTIGPKQLRRLIQRKENITEMQRRLVERREEIDRRRRELDSVASRIAQLAAESGIAVAPDDPIAQLRKLGEAAGQQEAAVARREAIRREARRIRANQAKHEEAISRLKHRRRQLFIEADVKDEQEFRRRVLEYARADVLRTERDGISREIEAALGSQCSEDAIRRELDAKDSGRLEKDRSEIRQRLTNIQEQLHRLLEKRGRLSEQIESILADRQLASKQLDLAILEKRLEDAIRRWQVLAATCRVLDTIRNNYEQHRQPETLQEASGYLDRLTQGHYRRVWTPLGEHVLRVDDAQGHALPVEVLSRGTREQLFLSLRLALASSYSRRGAPLPLVLDDVLVNYDTERAKAAAAVLRDFAAAGHQLLVFTCHEHILKLFKSLKVHVSRLPGNAEPGQMVISLESHKEEKNARTKKAPKAPRRKAAAKSRKSKSEPIGRRIEVIEDDVEEVEVEVEDEEDLEEEVPWEEYEEEEEEEEEESDDEDLEDFEDDIVAA